MLKQIVSLQDQATGVPMRTFLVSSLFVLPLFFGAAQAKAVEVGDQAPCVVLQNVAPDGSQSEHCIRDTNAVGQAKILEFFSATCSDCAQNLPIVSALAASVKQAATTRLVGIDRSEQLLREFIMKNRAQLMFEVALDTDRDAKRAYDVIETPTTFVLDANDKVLFRHAGILSNADVAAIHSLVGAQ
jgi:peroxiredoxin